MMRVVLLYTPMQSITIVYTNWRELDGIYILQKSYWLKSECHCFVKGGRYHGGVNIYPWPLLS